MHKKINLKSEVIKGLIEMSGFDKEEVSKKSRISLKSLDEGKLTIPQLKRLANVLKRPVVAFFSDEIPSLPEIPDYRLNTEKTIKEDKTMKSTKVLVNCSNHPSSKWSEDQKYGWDIIIDVPFPEVSPYLDTNDQKYQDIIIMLKDAIIKAFANAPVPAGVDFQEYLMLQGEFSVCYNLFKIRNIAFPNVTFVVPTTERVVEEIVKEDGTVEKKTQFKFIKWRMI
jgi:hypothetical protein